MLGWLIEKTTAVVSETYDIVADGVDYVYEDIKSIPDAIEKGWTNGLSSDDNTENKPTVLDTDII